MFTIRIGSTFGIIHKHSPKERKAILEKKKGLDKRQGKKTKANKKSQFDFKKGKKPSK